MSYCGRSPRSSTTRLPCWGRAYLCTDAGLARARPLDVCEAESGVKATVGPSCGINLSVQKHFILAATRAAKSCISGVWEAAGWSWTGWQPRIGCGRYGESVPLLLIGPILPRKGPRRFRAGLRAIDSKILMKSCPTWLRACTAWKYSARRSNCASALGEFGGSR